MRRKRANLWRSEPIVQNKNFASIGLSLSTPHQILDYEVDNISKIYGSRHNNHREFEIWISCYITWKEEKSNIKTTTTILFFTFTFQGVHSSPREKLEGYTSHDGAIKLTRQSHRNWDSNLRWTLRVLDGYVQLCSLINPKDLNAVFTIVCQHYCKDWVFIYWQSVFSGKVVTKDFDFS